MKHFLALAAILLFISCKKAETTTVKQTTATDTLAVTSADGKTKVYIKDRSKYDPSFIKAIERFSDTSIRSIKVIDDYVQMDSDTIIHFPSELQMDETYEFLANNQDHQYRLTVTKINHTSVHYIFIISVGEKITFTSNSNAHLNISFLLAGEVPEDEETGESYRANEYDNDYSKDGRFELLIGSADKKGRLRAVARNYNEDKMFPPELENMPTLRQIITIGE